MPGVAADKPLAFRIGQDSRWDPRNDQELYKSTIKMAYPVHDTARQKRVPSPPPAPIMATEPRIQELCSLSSSHFVKKTALPVFLGESASILRRTNFKMDSDPRTKSFTTTHNEYFPVRPVEKRYNSVQKRTYLLQGDREKLRLPPSVYKDSYQTDSSLPSIAVPFSALSKSSPILKGDPRTYKDQFETTSKTNFPVPFGTPEKLQPIKNNLSNFHYSGSDKSAYFSTTNQKFYKDGIIGERFENPGSKYYSKVVLGEEKRLDRPLCNYTTTTSDSFPMRQTGRARIANLNMAKSSLPEGDLDPERCHKRVTETSNNIFYQQPAPTFNNVSAEASWKRTKSDVTFGNVASDGNYDTTMKTNFPAKSQPYQNYGRIPRSSNVPLGSNNGDQVNNSITFIDFPSYDASRLIPSKEAMDKLTKSSIKAPVSKSCEYETTHSVYFPRKSLTNLRHEVDRRQRSSVPLGTMTYV